MARVRMFRKNEEHHTIIYIHCQNPRCRKLVQANSFYMQYCSKKCQQEVEKIGLVV